MDVEAKEWFSYLDGPTDEHRVAGLLMAARYLTQQNTVDFVVVRTVASKLASSGRFLVRLLEEDEDCLGEDSFLLSDAQRAGIEVVGTLSRADPHVALPALAPIAWEPLARLVERAADARLRAQSCDLQDLTRCLDCRAALRAAMIGAAGAKGGHGLASLAADVDLLQDPASALAVELLGSAMYDGGYVLTSIQVDALVRVGERLAAKVADERLRNADNNRSSTFDAAASVKEAMLLEVVASTFLRRGGGRRRRGFEDGDVLEELRSSQARDSTLAAFEVVSKSIPRLLALGASAPVQVRDSAIRLALTLTRAFGVEWLGEGRGNVLRFVTRIVASELRLTLDEALSLVEDGEQVERLGRAAPVCLGFLEAVVQGLLGDDDDPDDKDSDDEDEGSRLLHLVDAESVLAVREALTDSTEAALAFVGEMKLRRDTAALENAIFEDSPSLHICRECFRFLGRVAMDLDDDGSEDSIHSRLASLSPFVAELMALHQYQSGRRPSYEN